MHDDSPLRLRRAFDRIRAVFLVTAVVAGAVTAETSSGQDAGRPTTTTRPQPAESEQRYDLRGTIAGASGKPLKGATAYIYTAAVRRGMSPY